jgi:hypothetical protein
VDAPPYLGWCDREVFVVEDAYGAEVYGAWWTG